MDSGANADQLVSFLISSGEEPFTLSVEPEGMSYDFPEVGRLLLTFRGADAMKFELGHGTRHITVWRPANTEVYAAVQGSREPTKIAGYEDNPAPWLDRGSAAADDPPWVEWDHLPLPDRR